MIKHIYHLNDTAYFIKPEHQQLVSMDGKGEILSISNLSIFKRDEIYMIANGTFNAFIAKMSITLPFLIKEPSLLIRWRDNTTDQHIRAYLSILLGENNSETAETDKKVLQKIISERYNIPLIKGIHYEN